MQRFMDNLKQLAVVIPFFVAFFVLYGALKVTIFYLKYNVQIIDYIEFSELITYFIKDILIILFQTLLGVLMYKLVSLFKRKIANRRSHYFIYHKDPSKMEEQEMKRNNLVMEGLKRKIKTFAIIVSVVLLLIIVVYIYFGYYGQLIFLILAMGVQLAILFFINDVKLALVVVVLSQILSLSLFTSIIEWDLISKGNRNGYEVEFYDTGLVKSDSTYFYLGKTQQYIFFYNNKDQHADILKCDKIKRMKIPDQFLRNFLFKNE